MKKVWFVLAALVVFAAPAQAKEWQVDYDHSKLIFTGNQSGQKFDGGFKKFDADISFDPDHPEAGKITVSIYIDSAYAGSSDRDTMLPQSDWFDFAHFPRAKFTSTSIRKTGDGMFEMKGTLAIKSAVRDIVIPFILTPEGDHMRARGKVTLMRNEFGVGTGEFSNEDYVKFPVDLGFDLAAK